MRLEGKVAIVTGAARGIGYAIAKRFLMDGASVVLSDVNSAAASRAARELEQYGNIEPVAADVGDKLDIHNMLTYTATSMGRLDIFVNNAAITHQAAFLDLKEADFDRVLRVNLKGAFLCGQAAARRMVAQVEAGADAGTIINISSLNALTALPGHLAYAVSKGGLNQLTRAMAAALTQWGIRVNGIGPGPVETDMLSALDPGNENTGPATSPAPTGGIGQPDEIATIASFLASPDASYVTGQTIYADGGRQASGYIVPPS